LTAAHCDPLIEDGLDKLTISLGDHDASSKTGDELFLKASKWITVKNNLLKISAS